MTQERPKTTGDAMLVATDLLKPPKARTAIKILPRTIAWDHLFSVIIVAVVGLIVGVTFFSGLQAIFTCVLFGGAVGYMLPSLSPLEGESILMWFGLQAKSATAKRVNINGRRAKMYVGTYPLKRTALGATRLLPSSGSVKSEHYDERGYPELRTGKSASGQLEEQRKLRTKRQSKGLKASTSPVVHRRSPGSLAATR